MRVSENKRKWERGENVPLYSVEDKYDASVHHVPLIEWQLVHEIRDCGAFRNAEGAEHGLLPEASAAFDGGNRIDDA